MELCKCCQISPNIPKIGFGTNLYDWNQETKEDLLKALDSALKIGYRYFDLEDGNDYIIKHLNESKIDRKKLFISERIYTVPSIENTKNRIKEIGYLDMLYVGNPPATSSRNEFNIVMRNIWTGLLKVKAEGLVKHIGISNFHSKQLGLLIKYCDENEYQYPDFVFIETHPFNTNKDLIKLYQKYNIKIIGYSTLGFVGTSYFEENYDLQQFVKKNKLESYAQACIGFNLNRNISVVTKSLNEEHLRINYETEKYLDIDYTELEELNIYSPFNSDTTNSMIANGLIRK